MIEAAVAVAMLGYFGAPAIAHESDMNSGSRPAFVCENDTAQALYDAGFRGRDLREAWSIVMRESRGQNLIPGHWAFNGADYGIWQINAPSHSSKSWWSVSAMSDPVRQSRIVFKWSKGGDYWTPWGLTPDGELDTTYYGSWSSWQHQNWIIGPFKYFFAKFPRACEGKSVGEP